jgi:hypothetical protein
MNTIIPQEIRETLPDLYDSTYTTDPLCRVKLFTPDSNWTWFIIELSKEDNSTCYGYVQGLESELGYFSLEEIADVRGALNLPVERDINFEPTLLSTIQKENQ